MFKLSIAGVLAVLLFASASTQDELRSAKTRAIVRTIHIDQPGQNDLRYYYVPFEVPPSTQKISISYSYDRAHGSNTLDIGLFDPRFSEKDGDVSGFRGWSGGRRSDIFVSNKIATPGYLPGEIQQGTWRVIFGLYQVAAAGVDVTLKIELETDENKTTKLAVATSSSQISKVNLLNTEQAKSNAVPAPAKPLVPRWVSGDLHMHTVHSDGDWTVEQLVTAALEAGLDFISITDHNTNSHHADIERVKADRKKLLIIRGEEITTYGGHTNAWGLPENSLIDFRVQPRDKTAMARVVAEAHRHGALISINHPFGVCAGCMWGYGKEAEGFDAIEVWNGSWDAADELAVGFWDRLLQQGRRITAIASSDSHRAQNPLGQAATHLGVTGNLSEAALLQSIREGRAYLTSKSTSPVVTFYAQSAHSSVPHFIGDVIRAGGDRRINFKIGAANLTSPAVISLISDGKVVQRLQTRADGSSQDVQLNISRDTYFRIEVRDQSGTMLALTNPIYARL